MSESTDPRHLSREGLTEYMQAGVPAVVEVAGSPEAVLVIEPTDTSIAIRIDRQAGDAPGLELFKHFIATVVLWQGQQWVEIRVAKGVDPYEAYPVLCAILDRVQLEGDLTGPAVLGTLERFRELLAGLERLSDEAETGLFGELLVLKHLVNIHGPSTAYASWCGPTAAEHDFSLPTYDLEVKCTTAETRQHWINDLNQLVPTPGRSLYLLSVQLTSGGATGIKLPQLITQVRSLLDPTDRESFDHTLRSTFHWSPTQSTLYRRVFRLRSEPTPYLVDAAFPAITPKTLASAGLDESRFRKVRYQLDLSGLEPASGDPDNLRTIGEVPT